MKKIIPAVAIVGGVAAFIIYKMKKEQQKKVVSLDEGLLQDDELNDEIEEGPISDPASCCEDMKETFDDAKDEFMNTVDHVKDEVCDFKDDLQEHLQDTGEKVESYVTSEIDAIKKKSKELMAKMMEQGDVHEHERPVQHHVTFNTKEDLDNFKEKIINKGYVVTQGDQELELNILHISPMNEEKLMQNVQDIINCANIHHGKYGNWTSKIVY